MGRSAHASVRPEVDDPPVDEGPILHRIEDDLTDAWVDDLAASGVQALEAYLAKHLAFLLYLDGD